MTRTLTLALALLALGLSSLLAACGGADGDADANDAPRPLDDFAKSLLLTVNDFPAGWAEVPDTEDEVPSALKGCDDLHAPGISGRAQSGDFEKGSSDSFRESSAVFDSEAAAAASAETVLARADCYVKAVNAGELDEGSVKYSDASVSPVSFPVIAPRTAVYRVEIRGKDTKRTGLGSEATVYLDLIFAAKGRVAMVLIVSSVLSEPNTAMEEEFATRAVSKFKDPPGN